MRRLTETSISGQLFKGCFQRKINRTHIMFVLALWIKKMSNTVSQTKLLSVCYVHTDVCVQNLGSSWNNNPGFNSREVSSFSMSVTAVSTHQNLEKGTIRVCRRVCILKSKTESTISDLKIKHQGMKRKTLGNYCKITTRTHTIENPASRRPISWRFILPSDANRK